MYRIKGYTYRMLARLLKGIGRLWRLRRDTQLRGNDQEPDTRIHEIKREKYAVAGTTIKRVKYLIPREQR